MSEDTSFKNKKALQASLFVAISAILYGFLGYLGTTILRENISLPTMLFWRFLIAGGWMMLFVIRKHSTENIFDHIDKRTLFFMFSLGAIGYAGSSEFYFMASQYTGTGLAMVIFFSYPIMVALISWIIHGKSFNATTIAILITITIGLLLLRSSSSHEISLLGIFFALLGALCYAFYVIGGKKFSSVTVDSNVLTMAVCFGCALIFLFLALVAHSFIFPYSIKSWITLVALSILVTALPIQLMLEGLKHVSSMRASIISVLEPLVTVFVGMLLLQESVSHLQMLGAVIILGSALLVQLQKEL